MKAKARFLGHPIHQMLVVFPLGLLGTSVVFDVIHHIGGSPEMALVAYWTMAAGLIGGVVAAPFGLADWLAIPRGTRAKTVGALHGTGNVLVLMLFLASWMARREMPTEPELVATAAAVGGFAVAGMTAWLGGELVDRLGIGVDEGAHPNAPSSLRQP